MEVLVHVDMLEHQSGAGIRLELSPDFGAQLAPQCRASGDIDRQPDKIASQPAGAVHQVGDLLRRQRRSAFDQHQVQADAQARESARATQRIVGGRSADHQACGRQDAAPVRLFDGDVDLIRQAEIIGRYDQVLQCATPLRCRRNWKNSMPSRRRRRIISGLRIISETMAAIFGARK